MEKSAPCSGRKGPGWRRIRHQYDARLRHCPRGAPMETLKVSTKSNPNSVAGAMAGAVRQAGVVEVQVVGAGALTPATKAVAIARGYLAPAGIDLVWIPTFAVILIGVERRPAI